MTSMTIAPVSTQAVYVGIDTHKNTHHVAVTDLEGRPLSDQEFPTTAAGIEAITTWLTGWEVLRVGVEQTGTYGIEVTRTLTAAGHTVRDVNVPDLSVRARYGKSDPVDAVMAANAVRTGRATTIAKDRSGVIEAIRVLHTARASAVKARTAALVQLASLAILAPAGLRDRLGTTSRQIAGNALRLRPDPTRGHDPEQALKTALRSIAGRIADLDTEITNLDHHLHNLVTTTAPHLLALPQVGINTAAQLLITAGQNIDRIHSDAAFARLCGIAPIPASSGQTHRMRLHAGGDRQANKAIHLVAIGRLKNHQPAIDYYQRRTSQGLSKNDAIRAMKRLIAREIYGALKTDLRALDAL